MIKYLELHNWRVFNKLTLHLDSGTTFVVAENGIGKTSLLYTLPTDTTLCLDLEAGMKAVQSWPGESSRIRTFADALDIACLIGGVDPAADAQSFFPKVTMAMSSRSTPIWSTRSPRNISSSSIRSPT